MSNGVQSAYGTGFFIAKQWSSLCVFNSIHGKGHIVVLGDFNGKVGSREARHETYIGKHGTGRRNERGQTIVDFCGQSKLFILNTRFQKRETRKWTWQSPDMRTQNAIDYVMALDTSIIQDVSIICGFRFSTDHRLLLAKVQIHSSTKRLYYNAKPRMMLDQSKFATGILALTRTDVKTYESIATKMRSVALNSNYSDYTSRAIFTTN